MPDRKFFDLCGRVANAKSSQRKLGDYSSPAYTIEIFSGLVPGAVKPPTSIR